MFSSPPRRRQIGGVRVGSRGLPPRGMDFRAAGAVGRAGVPWRPGMHIHQEAGAGSGGWREAASETALTWVSAQAEGSHQLLNPHPDLCVLGRPGRCRCGLRELGHLPWWSGCGPSHSGLAGLALRGTGAC